MSESELIDAVNSAQDSALLAVSRWTDTPEILATLKHAVEAATAAVQQAQAAVPEMLSLAQEGGNSSPPAIQDAIVAVESAVGRAEIAEGEITRLAKTVEDAHSLTQGLVVKLKAVLQAAESL
jgi:hypothetical protein